MTRPEYPRCDRAFDPAIERGFLTVQQAIERGDRAHYAVALQQKYGLDQDRAYSVTDNMMSLADALAAQSGGLVPVEVTDPSGTHWVWSTVQVTLALAVIAAGTYAVFRQKESPKELVLNAVATRAPSGVRRAPSPEPPAPPREIVAIQTSSEGQVTEVTGPDPKSVLLSLCRHPQFAQTLSPIALAPSFPPSTGSRLGLIRDLADPAKQRCVAIRRDARSGRWSAGNGLEPLEIQVAPKLPPETILTPL